MEPNEVPAAAEPRVPWAFTALTAVCLAVAVASQTGSLVRTLRWFAAEVADAQPYELRLRLNDRFRDAVAVARDVDAWAPGETPVLIDDRASTAWFVGLRLQPRRVFLDVPEVREDLASAGQPFFIVHIVKPDGGPTRWWFEIDDGQGRLRRVEHRMPTISRCGFEGGFDGWSVVGAQEHRE